MTSIRSAGRRGTLAVAALVLGSVATIAPAAAPVAAAPVAAAPVTSQGVRAAALTSITLSGHGFGHGRGMGQYGAYGYAVTYAYSASRILARFYGGTRLVSSPAAAASRKLTVRLTAWDGEDVRITSRAAFRAGGVPFAAGKVALLRYSASTRAVTVSSTSSCTSSAVSPVARIDSGAAQITSSVSAPGADVGKMLSVCDGSVQRSYRGLLTFRSVDSSASGRRLINTVGVDDYLRGVLPREMPASWADTANGRGAQALQAQAVVARSYALAAPAHRSYANVCDTAACQVYGGAGTAGRLIEDNRATRAVSATTGRVLVTSSSGAIAKTEFSASTGGFSAGGVFPAASDAGDATAPGNIYHSWTLSRSTQPLQDRYRAQIGTLTELRITQRDAGNRRVVSVRLYGTGGYTDPIPGDDIAYLLGLYSSWFTTAR